MGGEGREIEHKPVFAELLNRGETDSTRTIGKSATPCPSHPLCVFHFTKEAEFFFIITCPTSSSNEEERKSKASRRKEPVSSVYPFTPMSDQSRISRYNITQT